MTLFSYKLRDVFFGGLILLIYATLVYADSTVKLNKSKVIDALTVNYGERAAKRGYAWFDVMGRSSSFTELEKLRSVNNFFNQLRFVDDLLLWGEKNYWATPIEFIGANGGDCEDFAIAKYFTLLELGIIDEKMRITMVKAVRLNQYHMVVAYYQTPGSEPLILDNIDGVIKPASKRPDLIPVYSFNGKQLWLNKKKGKGVVVGKPERIKRWGNLNQRMGLSKMRLPKLSME